MEIIVKAYKDGDFAFVYFSDKEDLDRNIDGLLDGGFTIEASSKEEEELIISQRCHEETTPAMMQRVEELMKILRKF